MHTTMIIMEYRKAKKLQRWYAIIRVVLLCVLITALYILLLVTNS